MPPQLTPEPTGPVHGFTPTTGLTHDPPSPPTHVLHHHRHHCAEPDSGPYADRTGNNVTPVASKRPIEFVRGGGSSLVAKKPKNNGVLSLETTNTTQPVSSDDMQCKSEDETTVDTAEDTRNNEANTIDKMLLVDEQMIGFKGRHGMDLRLPHIPIGYFCQLIGETPFRLSPLPLMVKNIEKRTMSICNYNKSKVSVDLHDRLRNNHRRGGLREQVATRFMTSACQMKHKR